MDKHRELYIEILSYKQNFCATIFVDKWSEVPPTHYEGVSTMFEESVVSAFEVPLDLPENTCEASLEVSIEPVKAPSEVRAKSAKEIAEEFGVTDKTIQTWFKSVCAAYPWIASKTLKTGNGNKIRYTPLCQALIVEYRTAAIELSEEDWIASVHAANPEKLAPNPLAASTEIPVRPTEVVPLTDDDRLPLPPVDRTAAGSLVPTGSSYLSALEEEELELQQLETQELELLERMNINLERLDHNQTQWQRTNDLRRQRLLRQARLEAAALATELEAEFEETLRESQYNIRRGSVGKCAVETPRSQSA